MSNDPALDAVRKAAIALADAEEESHEARIAMYVEIARAVFLGHSQAQACRAAGRAHSRWPDFCRALDRDVPECVVDECSNPNEARGLCGDHERERKQRPKERRQCTRPDCDRVHWALDYCLAHYRRHTRGKPLDGPIGGNKRKDAA